MPLPCHAMRCGALRCDTRLYYAMNGTHLYIHLFVLYVGFVDGTYESCEMIPNIYQSNRWNVCVVMYSFGSVRIFMLSYLYFAGFHNIISMELLSSLLLLWLLLLLLLEERQSIARSTYVHHPSSGICCLSSTPLSSSSLEGNARLKRKFFQNSTIRSAVSGSSPLETSRLQRIPQKKRIHFAFPSKTLLKRFWVASIGRKSGQSKRGHCE